MLYRKKPDTLLQRFKVSITIPFIFIILIPVLLLDFFVELYHQICFRIYGIPLIKRKNYIVYDRAKLSYLPWWDKLDCLYCSYVNGFLGYARVIAAQTEAYWCGIKHKGFPGYVEPDHHKDFAKYGDEEEFKKKYSKQTESLSN